MSTPKPLDAITQLVQAINSRDLDAALALYEQGAVMVAQPGKVVVGTEGLRNALAGFMALKPTLMMEARELIQAGDLALYCSRWNLRGVSPDGKEVQMKSSSTDVLRRQSDGNWLIAIDNPWGIEILPYWMVE